jgi:dihydroorotate dehydrogenase (NAD+) catalytic subunit
LSFSVQLAPQNDRGLELVNPVMTASGTFGYGTEYSHLFDIQRLGAIVCKGTTLEPRQGNPQPRLAEVEHGLLNSVGLENIGLQALIAEKAPVWAGWQVPVIVNIAAGSVADYALLASRLDNVAGVAALEVNISCPNIKDGCEFGAEPKSAAAVMEAVRRATSLPVLVKLSPATTNMAAMTRAVTEAGADAVTIMNTLKGMAIDVGKRRPLLGNVTGGLSGPAVKPVALAMVYEVAGATTVPVIGCGGISSATDALEFIMAGATAVQVGTASLVNPRALIAIIEGIEKYLAEEGIKDIKDLVGVGRG